MNVGVDHLLFPFGPNVGLPGSNERIETERNEIKWLESGTKARLKGDWNESRVGGFRVVGGATPVG